MVKKADYLKKYIEELLLPVAQSERFFLIKPKLLVRVKGPFIDCISFQVSQHGNKSFHVHYYKNLISDPLLDIDAYRVGNRLSSNEQNGDDTEWYGSDAGQAEFAIRSVVEAYTKTIRPWFESVTTIAEYVFELAASHQNRGFYSLEDAIAFAEGGKRDRAWWICSDILNEAQVEAIGEAEKVKRLKVNEVCQQYSDTHDVESLLSLSSDDADGKIVGAISQIPSLDFQVRSIDDLLKQWKRVNIEKFKLSVCVA